MTTYCCLRCGERFHEPTIRVTRENLDGERGWETRTEYLCPVCGDDQIEETTEDDDAETDLV